MKEMMKVDEMFQECFPKTCDHTCPSGLNADSCMELMDSDQINKTGLLCDPFIAYDVKQLTTAKVVASAKCKTALDSWINSTVGWGCCSSELWSTVIMEDTSGMLAAYSDEMFKKNSVTQPNTCEIPDGGAINACFRILNFDYSYYSTMNAKTKASLHANISANVAMLVGVKPADVAVDTNNTKEVTGTTAATKGIDLCVVVNASGASQAVKVISVLNSYTATARRDSATKGFSVKSLTSSPDARSDKSQPVVSTTTSASAVYQIVDESTALVVAITVTMPYTKAEFDEAKQAKYKRAIASVAGTSDKNIRLEIAEKKRRAGSIEVTTKILAGDSKRLEEIKKTLGTDTTVLLSKINTALKKEGLAEATGVTQPADLGALSAGVRTHGFPGVVVASAIAMLVCYLTSALPGGVAV